MVSWLIENRFIDALVSTGANVSEDIVDAMRLGYWLGSFEADDEALLRADINRYYDVFGKESDYRAMEELLTELLLTLDPTFVYSSAELLYLLGLRLHEGGVNSIAAAVAASHDVPIFAPALADGAFGEAFLMSVFAVVVGRA